MNATSYSHSTSEGQKSNVTYQSSPGDDRLIVSTEIARGPLYLNYKSTPRAIIDLLDNALDAVAKKVDHEVPGSDNNRSKKCSHTANATRSNGVRGKVQA